MFSECLRKYLIATSVRLEHMRLLFAQRLVYIFVLHSVRGLPGDNIYKKYAPALSHQCHGLPDTDICCEEGLANPAFDLHFLEGNDEELADIDMNTYKSARDKPRPVQSVKAICRHSSLRDNQKYHLPLMSDNIQICDFTCESTRAEQYIENYHLVSHARFWYVKDRKTRSKLRMLRPVRQLKRFTLFCLSGYKARSVSVKNKRSEVKALRRKGVCEPLNDVETLPELAALQIPRKWKRPYAKRRRTDKHSGEMLSQNEEPASTSSDSLCIELDATTEVLLSEVISWYPEVEARLHLPLIQPFGRIERDLDDFLDTQSFSVDLEGFSK